MILSWMFYGVAIGVLLGGAAIALEYCLRAFRFPTRFIWLGAMAFSVVLPVTGLLSSWLNTMPMAATAAVGAQAAPVTTAWDVPIQLLASAESRLPGLDFTVASLWIGSSALLLLFFLWSYARLNGHIVACRPTSVNGVPVLLSDSLGPAVVGLRRPEIVLPSWVFTYDQHRLGMIVRHELEHLRKRDQQVLLSAGALVLLLPWNLALWWQLGRLRLAVEADCDNRLLNAGVSRREYGRLLLDIGTRVRRVPSSAIAFSPTRSSLFRRIQLMTSNSRKRLWQVSGAITGALFLAFAACETPTPPNLDLEDSAEASVVGNLPVDIDSSTDSSYIVVRVKEHAEQQAQAESEAEPLLFIDGVAVEFGSELESLEPGSIDRIEVIKNDAARAQYGEQAANGVINIYLKKVLEIDSTGSN